MLFFLSILFKKHLIINHKTSGMIATKTNCLELIKNKKWRTLIPLLQELDAIEVADLVEGYSKTNKMQVLGHRK